MENLSHTGGSCLLSGILSDINFVEPNDNDLTELAKYILGIEDDTTTAVAGKAVC